jgi:methylisocitrate lyase
MNRPNRQAPQQLKSLLDQPGIIMMPGAFNAISAQLIQQQGFQAAYITGAGLINGMTGYPDIDMLSMAEVSQFAGYITDSVNIPCICDADTGYGDVLQVRRTVEQFEKAGLAGLHLEDQVSPKRCGHLDGKTVISVEAMQAKIAAAIEARQSPDFLIIARVDSKSVHGFEDALYRAKAYKEAGADMIFPEAMESQADFATMSRSVDIPMMANMTEFGKSPYLSASDFEALGYKIVIYPMTLFRTAMFAMEGLLKDLKQTGSQRAWLDKMQTRHQLYDLLDYERYNTVDASYPQQFLK